VALAPVVAALLWEQAGIARMGPQSSCCSSEWSWGGADGNVSSDRSRDARWLSQSDLELRRTGGRVADSIELPGIDGVSAAGDAAVSATDCAVFGGEASFLVSSPISVV
jgi:hypothetical protein